VCKIVAKFGLICKIISMLQLPGQFGLCANFFKFNTGLQLTLINLQRGPKKRTCLSVDNSKVVSSRKTCDMSKVLQCCKE